MSTKDKVNTILEELAQERDELRVRAKLASMELKDEWEQAEEQFRHLKTRAKSAGQHLSEVADEAGDAGEDVWEATKLLAEQVGVAFRRVRQKL